MSLSGHSEDGVHRLFNRLDRAVHRLKARVAMSSGEISTLRKQLLRVEASHSAHGAELEDLQMLIEEEKSRFSECRKNSQPSAVAPPLSLFNQRSHSSARADYLIPQSEVDKNRTLGSTNTLQLHVPTRDTPLSPPTAQERKNTVMACSDADPAHTPPDRSGHIDPRSSKSSSQQSADSVWKPRSVSATNHVDTAFFGSSPQTGGADSSPTSTRGRVDEPLPLALSDGAPTGMRQKLQSAFSSRIEKLVDPLEGHLAAMGSAPIHLVPRDLKAFDTNSANRLLKAKGSLFAKPSRSSPTQCPLPSTFIRFDGEIHENAPTPGQHGALTLVETPEILDHEKTYMRFPLFCNRAQWCAYIGDYRIHNHIIIPRSVWAQWDDDVVNSLARRVRDSHWGQRLLVRKRLARTLEDVQLLNLEQILQYFSREEEPCLRFIWLIFRFVDYDQNLPTQISQKIRGIGGLWTRYETAMADSLTPSKQTRLDRPAVDRAHIPTTPDALGTGSSLTAASSPLDAASTKRKLMQVSCESKPKRLRSSPPPARVKEEDASPSNVDLTQEIVNPAGRDSPQAPGKRHAQSTKETPDWWSDPRQVMSGQRRYDTREMIPQVISSQHRYDTRETNRTRSVDYRTWMSFADLD